MIPNYTWLSIASSNVAMGLLELVELLISSRKPPLVTKVAMDTVYTQQDMPTEKEHSAQLVWLPSLNHY